MPKDFNWIGKRYEVYNLANKDPKIYNFMLNEMPVIEYYRYQLINAIDTFCEIMNNKETNKSDKREENEYE